MDHIIEDGPGALADPERVGGERQALLDTSTGQQLDSDLGGLVFRLRRELDELRSDRNALSAELPEFQARIERVEKGKFSLQNFVVSISLFQSTHDAGQHCPNPSLDTQMEQVHQIAGPHSAGPCRYGGDQVISRMGDDLDMNIHAHTPGNIAELETCCDYPDNHHEKFTDLLNAHGS